MGSEEVENHSEGYEIAEEVRPIEPLTLTAAQIRAHAIAAEYALVCRSPVDGMYVIPSYADTNKWFGVLFIRRGVFQGAIFRFLLFVQSDFPDTTALPVVRFESDVFHPLVHQKTREVEMRRFFPEGWKKEKHHIVNVLIVVQRIFFSLDGEAECANDSAALLWKKDKRLFRETARLCVDNSRENVYDDFPDRNDPNSIRFTAWCADVHESTRAAMLSGGGAGGKRDRDQTRSFTWLHPDTLTYMAEPVPEKSIKMSNMEEGKEESQDRIRHGIDRLDLSTVFSDEEAQHNQVEEEVVLSKESSVDLEERKEEEERENGEDVNGADNDRISSRQVEVVGESHI